MILFQLCAAHHHLEHGRCCPGGGVHHWRENVRHLRQGLDIWHRRKTEN